MLLAPHYSSFCVALYYVCHMLLFVSILCNVHHFKMNMQCIIIKNNNVTFLHLQVANRVEKVSWILEKIIKLRLKLKINFTSLINRRFRFVIFVTHITLFYIFISFIISV